VDKYAPHSFTQLLSPEKINREVLKALKKWDRYVFKGDGEFCVHFCFLFLFLSPMLCIALTNPTNARDVGKL